MALNRFNIWVLLQIILIAGVGMLIVISFGREYMLMTTAGLFLIWVGQILFLNFFMSRIHRDVLKFMEALKNQDTSLIFSRQKQGKYFGRLHTSFNEITRNFRLVRIDKEVENQFFRETIKQSASGMMAVTGEGTISLINKAALQILGLEYLNNLSELSKIHPDLVEILSKDDLEGPPHVKILTRGKMVQLAVKATEMNLKGTPVRIFSLLDISREMARSEVEAWQKLIRVLNHEITNSVTPIHILSTSLFDLFHQGKKQKTHEDLDEQTIDRTILGLKTIVKRSGGLTEFLNTYKSFTETGNPDYSSLKVFEMLKHIQSLLAGEMKKAGVELNISVIPTDLRLMADEKLIEQCIINLVQNSIHALKGKDFPSIQIKAYELKEKVSIEITDNGKGISKEVLDHIFTPFFTTRKDGSGIGLSLARQTMLMHNGSIHVNSKEGEQTIFTLTF